MNIIKSKIAKTILYMAGVVFAYLATNPAFEAESFLAIRWDYLIYVFGLSLLMTVIETDVEKEEKYRETIVDKNSIYETDFYNDSGYLGTLEDMYEDVDDDGSIITL